MRCREQFPATGKVSAQRETCRTSSLGSRPNPFVSTIFRSNWPRRMAQRHYACTGDCQGREKRDWTTSLERIEEHGYHAQPPPDRLFHQPTPYSRCLIPYAGSIVWLGWKTSGQRDMTHMNFPIIERRNVD